MGAIFNRSSNGMFLPVAFVIFVFCAVAFGDLASAAEVQVLRDHVPPVTARLQPVSRLAASERLNLAIGMPLRNRDALTNLLHQLYDPKSSTYHHYLTADQFAETFGPTETDYEQLIAFVRKNGLTVTGRHANRLLLDVNGPTADIERALHVSMFRYQHPKERRTFYAPDRNPSLDFSVPILGIAGLDSYSLPRPRYRATPLSIAKSMSPKAGSAPGGAYMGHDFRMAYVPDSVLTGSGQTVGLLQFDGYTASDIIEYENAAGLPNVPLINVLVGGFSGAPTGQGGEVEVSLDIEMVMSMAPGLAAIYVYEAPNPSPWVDVLNRMATDNLARQISCSWYLPGGGPDPVADGIWQEMAAQGQSFFNASGDYDAFSGPVDFPGDNPFITQVGGTTLETDSGASWNSEVAWNWGDGMGTGGGISTAYPLPAWQANLDMTANQGSTSMRNIPDVALTADNVYVRANGTDYNVGGTSCAAPLWAGFAALANQQAANHGQPPIGFVNPAIYAIGRGASYYSCFHDITVGDNRSSSSPTKFLAQPGYDLCTGWGTPAGQNLIDAFASPLSTPPSIVTQPRDNTVPTADTAILFVTATGSFPFSYQWSFKGTNITGATNSQLVLTDVTTNQSGQYSVVVSNAFGFVPSSNAILVVLPPVPPAITVQPQDQTVAAGGIARFGVTVTGTRPAYQWTFDDSNIPSATSNALILFNVQPSDAGNYAVQVTNVAGSAISSNALLTVIPPGTNCEAVPSGLVAWWAGEGDAYNLADGSQGTLDGTIDFAAGKIGRAFSFDGTNADVHILPSDGVNIGVGDGFTIEGWINPADVTQMHPLVEWVQTASFANGVMLYISIPAIDGGGGPGSLVFNVADFNYGEHFVSTPPGLIMPNVWQHVAATYDKTTGEAVVYINGTALGRTNVGIVSPKTTLDLWLGYNAATKFWSPPALGAQTHFAGQMDEISLYNRALSTEEIRAIYTAGSYGKCPEPPTKVVIQPINQTVFAGYSATFAAVAGGALPFTYQWYFNGTNIADATNSSLTLTNIQLGQAGHYAVTVSNQIGGVTSPDAILTVDTHAPPAIVSGPSNQVVTVGNTAILQVSAVGTPPLSYQWKSNYVSIGGATNSVLTLTNVQPRQAGFYEVQVSNAYSSVLSSDAVVIVPKSPNWMLTTAPFGAWSSVASSADGAKLVACIRYPNAVFYTSTNSGMTWIARFVTNGTFPTPFVTSSADGTRLAAAIYNGRIFTSTNSGVTWTQTAAPFANWYSTASSADGLKLVALAQNQGGIYTSSNGGITWALTSAPTNNWRSVCSSTDGTHMAATADGVGIFTSANSGVTWNLTGAFTNRTGAAIACSADGTKLAAAFFLDSIYVSTNSGASWKPTSAPSRQWASIASSADGIRLVATANQNGPVYRSIDSGATWTQLPTPTKTDWSCVASSADGGKLVAVNDAGGIFIWQAVPALNINCSGDDLLLGWPVFWTGMGLQQNFDLATTNWMSVTNGFILSNWCNQVSLPPLGSNLFFRLKSP